MAVKKNNYFVLYCKDFFDGKTPECCAPSEFSEWAKLARKSQKSNNENGNLSFCDDCTHQYQKNMISKGRCKNPQIVFIKQVRSMKWLKVQKKLAMIFPRKSLQK